MNIEVNGDDDRIGQEVASANQVESERVIERDLLGNLHHSKDDNQVGTAR